MNGESDSGLIVKGIVFILAFIVWGAVSDYIITVYAESAKLGITTFFSLMSSMMSGGTLEQTGKNVVNFTVFTIDFTVACLGAIGTYLALDILVKMIMGLMDLIVRIFGGEE